MSRKPPPSRRRGESLRSVFHYVVALEYVTEIISKITTAESHLIFLGLY